MAHLKRFSLANRLKGLHEKIINVPPIVIYGDERSGSLSYRNNGIIDLNQRIMGELISLQKATQHFKQSHLAANQLMSEQRAFALNMNNKNNSWGSCEQNDEIKVFINPEVVYVSENEFVFDWEYSASFPFMKTRIGRYKRIQITYQDFEFEDHQMFANDFQARLIQQSIDLLNGFNFFDCRVSRGDWEILDEYKKSMPKTVMAINHYKQEIQKLLESHPELFVKRSMDNLNNSDREQVRDFSFEDLMLKRFNRYIQREYLDPRANKGQGDQLYEQLKSQQE